MLLRPALFYPSICCVSVIENGKDALLGQIFGRGFSEQSLCPGPDRVNGKIGILRPEFRDRVRLFFSRRVPFFQGLYNGGKQLFVRLFFFHDTLPDQVFFCGDLMNGHRPFVDTCHRQIGIVGFEFFDASGELFAFRIPLFQFFGYFCQLFFKGRLPACDHAVFDQKLLERIGRIARRMIFCDRIPVNVAVIAFQFGHGPGERIFCITRPEEFKRLLAVAAGVHFAVNDPLLDQILPDSHSEVELRPEPKGTQLGCQIGVLLCQFDKRPAERTTPIPFLQFRHDHVRIVPSRTTAFRVSCGRITVRRKKLFGRFVPEFFCEPRRRFTPSLMFAAESPILFIGKSNGEFGEKQIDPLFQFCRFFSRTVENPFRRVFSGFAIRFLAGGLRLALFGYFHGERFGLRLVLFGYFHGERFGLRLVLFGCFHGERFGLRLAHFGFFHGLRFGGSLVLFGLFFGQRFCGRLGIGRLQTPILFLRSHSERTGFVKLQIPFYRKLVLIFPQVFGIMLAIHAERFGLQINGVLFDRHFIFERFEILKVFAEGETDLLRLQESGVFRRGHFPFQGVCVRDEFARGQTKFFRLEKRGVVLRLDFGRQFGQVSCDLLFCQPVFFKTQIVEKLIRRESRGKGSRVTLVLFKRDPPILQFNILVILLDRKTELFRFVFLFQIVEQTHSVHLVKEIVFKRESGCLSAAAKGKGMPDMRGQTRGWVMTPPRSVSTHFAVEFIHPSVQDRTHEGVDMLRLLQQFCDRRAQAVVNANEPAAEN